MSDSDEFCDIKTKKRKVKGRLNDVAKKIRMQSHEAGSSCKCRNNCFDSEGLTLEVRDTVLKNFNLLESVNEQNSYLCGLISIVPVQKRRPTVAIESAKLRDVTCKYKVRAVQNEKVCEWLICRKAFISIHGITNKKIEYLINALKETGCAPKDKRGNHKNRPHKISDEVRDLIKEHIGSFNGRGAHYCLKDTSKKYLPDDLNISIMHKMFTKKYPNVKCSYETYRSSMQQNFNISFGYPRTDTCSFCDENNVKINGLKAQLKDGEDKTQLDKDLKTLETDLKLHKLKAQKFYDIKKKARLTSKKITTYEGICIDYGRNLNVPNVTTNDAYYKRQLSVYSFNVHILGSGKSVFYMYNECDGRKGSDNVCQMLYHFVNNYLPEDVMDLHIFGDSCGGQNKNLTMYRFLHYMVHVQKRFKSVQFTYPIRGHSYTECDRNMGCVKSNFWADLPSEWADHIRDARQNPSPFIVEEIDYTFWREWTTFFQQTYSKKIPVLIRAMREIKVTQTSDRLLHFRNNYSGHWDNVVITKPKRKRFHVEQSTLPEFSYTGKLPISMEKYKDIMDLTRYCKNLAAKQFFINLPHGDNNRN
ncbi:uncharacterized protein LOC111064490 [Nilaparvata lugens]|uniref:uncharacterized protein LOC111064490 n=1 Tax=Nilaparvata lugens TaxID=108931 RepID=UPI000B98578F|nr:uncharacterized protein LOC111064490 [Nilaparvata lugens]